MRNKTSILFKIRRKDSNDVANKRVVGLVSWCFLPESYRFRVWAVCFGRDRSDPAAHAEHYGKFYY